MGRGLGPVQRAVLAALEARARTPHESYDTPRLLRDLYGPEPTKDQVRSVHRALRQLEARGLIRQRPVVRRMPARSRHRLHGRLIDHGVRLRATVTKAIELA